MAGRAFRIAIGQHYGCCADAVGICSSISSQLLIEPSAALSSAFMDLGVL